MSDHDAIARRAEAVTIERWEYDNPSWVVVARYPVITTALDGKIVEDIEVLVHHRETGEEMIGLGTTLAMALALVTHRISERPEQRWL